MNTFSKKIALTTMAITTVAGASVMTMDKAEAKTSKYVVKSGDSLSGISYKKGVSVGNIKKWNKLKTDMIWVGQELTVSKKKSEIKKPNKKPAKKPSKKPVSTHTTTSKGSTGYYTVQSGDSLSLIGQKFGMYVSDLKNLNKLTNDTLMVGQKLKVKKSANKKPKAQSKPKPSVQNKPSKTKPVSKPSNKKTHTVQSGESLSLIASKYGTSVSIIKSLNNMKSDMIWVGQVLKVSGKASQGSTNSHTNSNNNNSSNNNFNQSYIDLIDKSNIVSSITHTKTNGYSKRIINEGKKYLGVPYVWGGSSTTALDCSGFVYRVLNESGIAVPRTTSRGFYSMATKIKPSQVQVGDLVFFAEDGITITHISIYMGDGNLIHASGDRVNIQKLNNTYWNKRVVGYGRIR